MTNLEYANKNMKSKNLCSKAKRTNSISHTADVQRQKHSFIYNAFDYLVQHVPFTITSSVCCDLVVNYYFSKPKLKIHIYKHSA